MEILNKNELAALLRVEIKTINYLLYSRQLPRFKVGREYRFMKTDILRWIKGRSEGNPGSVLDNC